MLDLEKDGESHMEKFAIYETKLGYLKLSYLNDKIVEIDKVDEPDDFGKKSALTDRVHQQLVEYFEGKRKRFDFAFEFHGTPFQEEVWKALLSIPYGETRTYKDIAIRIGSPKACRAVGMANNKNRLSIVVPCHRVIGSNGKLVGYASGLSMKEFLLNLESENAK